MENIRKVWICRDSNGNLSAYFAYPHRNDDYWDINPEDEDNNNFPTEDLYINLNGELWPEITWDTKEPFEISTSELSKVLFQESPSPSLETREKALELAIKLSGSLGGEMIGSVISVAHEFEKYLKGDY